jgi:hypothetical protein
LYERCKSCIDFFIFYWHSPELFRRTVYIFFSSSSQRQILTKLTHNDFYVF